MDPTNLPIHCPKCAQERGVAIPRECPHQLVPVMPTTELTAAIERVRGYVSNPSDAVIAVDSDDVLTVCDAAARADAETERANGADREAAEMLRQRDVTEEQLRLAVRERDEARCLLPDATYSGRCCCNCRWLAEDRSHPNTDGGSISERRGFVCLAPEFVEERQAKMIAFIVRTVFSGWSEHGICEMHDFRHIIGACHAAK